MFITQNRFTSCVVSICYYWPKNVTNLFPETEVFSNDIQSSWVILWLFKVTYILLPNKRTCFNITMLHINHDNTEKFYRLNVSIGPGTYILKGICNYHKFRNILRYVMKVNMNFQYMLSNIMIHNMQTFEKQPSIYSRNCFLHFLSIIWP